MPVIYLKGVLSLFTGVLDIQNNVQSDPVLIFWQVLYDLHFFSFFRLLTELATFLVQGLEKILVYEYLSVIDTTFL